MSYKTIPRWSETIRSRRLLRLSKFALAGMSGYLLHLGLLALLVNVAGLYYLMSAIFASLINITWNFGLKDRWVFHDRRNGRMAWRYIRYFTLAAMVAVLYLALLRSFVNVLGFHYILGAILALGISGLLSFTASYIWVWGRQISITE